MTILKGKAVFTCPKTGQEVRLDKECTNHAEKGNNCQHFIHWGWSGTRPILTCNAKKKEEVTKNLE